jgi:preprotein translocase subunit YajC
VIISSAFAQAPAAAPQDVGLLGSPIVLIVVMIAFMYFFIFRPQSKRQKEHKQLIDSLQKGDEVVALGGVVGRITKLSDQYVTLEIAPSTEIVVQRAAVQHPLPKGTIKTLQ